MSAIVALAYLMVGSMASDYDAPGIVDSSFSENYDKLNENTEDINQLWTATTNKSGLNLINTADVLLSSTFSIAQIVFGGVKTFSSQLSTIPQDFDIPKSVSNILIGALISVIAVGIIFGIINAVNKTNKL
jgi:hypothetical protein